MEYTWASGSLELLKHADSHIQLDTDFYRRMAFISVDNSVETSIRIYFSLPEKIQKVKFQRKELEEVGNSFPKMFDLLFGKVQSKLIGLEEGDIDNYHRIRNHLYHNVTGLSVDRHMVIPISILVQELTKIFKLVTVIY